MSDEKEKTKYVKVTRWNKDKPVVAYSGSMIQQNHGEKPYGHGYVLWDVKSRTGEHREVKNLYGYYTIEIRNGKCVSDLSLLPNRARLRVKVYNTTAAETKLILADIRKETNITELSVTRCDAISEMKQYDRDNKFNFGDVTNVGHQNKLMEDYLGRNFVVDEKQLQVVADINADVNERLPIKESLRNCMWKPKRFEFGNMFSYGEKNVVDFSSMKSVMGLFASNASGKSSLMSAFSFCLFDKCDRAFKASHVLNTSSEDFSCKLDFEINGVDYFIERIATAKVSGEVKVDVEFWKEVEGEKISLNGDQRRGTNDIIRNHVGTYDDFVLTSLSLQNNNAIFIDKSQSERKDLLAQFMGIDIFDRLHSLASEDIKEVNALLKRFNKEDFSEILSENKKKLASKKEVYGEQLDIVDDWSVEQRELNESIYQKNSEYKTCSVDESDLDIDKLEFERKNLNDRLENIRETRETSSTEKDDLEDSRDKLVKRVEKYEDSGVEREFYRMSEVRDKLIPVEKDLAVLRTTVSGKLEKLKHFEDHEYDPECDYCTKNAKSFIENATITKDELERDKERADKLIALESRYKDEIEDYDSVKSNHDKLKECRGGCETIRYKIKDKDSKVLALSSMLESVEKDIETNTAEIAMYHECKDTIVHNQTLKGVVEKIKETLGGVTTKLEKETAVLQKMFGELKVLEKEHSDIMADITEAKDFEKRKYGYELYLDAVDRNGIPYELISKIMPSIESEVNNILAQIVDFGMQLEMDGKNIHSKIVYEDRHWPLEMCSGMERFISSIAMRVALINVSSLPRSNFLVIDEGWGSLDGDNISSVFNLFTYLKGQFEFILVISHLDIMRDMVDEIIEIQQVGEFSKIIYE